MYWCKIIHSIYLLMPVKQQWFPFSTSCVSSLCLSLFHFHQPRTNTCLLLLIVSVLSLISVLISLSLGLICCFVICVICGIIYFYPFSWITCNLGQTSLSAMLYPYFTGFDTSFSLSFSFKYFMIPIVISSLTRGLFLSTLCSLQIFGCFLVFTSDF